MPPAYSPIAAKGTAATPNYANFPYPSYAAGQYRSGYSYTPTAGNYYPNAYAQSGGQQPQTPGGHYTNQQYTGAGQQQYSYGSWYNYQHPAAQTQSGQATSGTVQQPATPAANSYASFFNTQQQQAATPQRAVANTVAAAAAGKQYAAGVWPAPNAAAGAFTPTLPPHMRGVGTPGAQPPGTPAAQGGYPYYSNYQQQQQQQAATGQR